MNVDLHLMFEARNYATKLQRELEQSRKSHYEQVAAVEGELQQTRSELAEAYRRLQELNQVLNPAKNAAPQASRPRPQREFS